MKIYAEIPESSIIQTTPSERSLVSDQTPSIEKGNRENGMLSISLRDEDSQYIGYLSPFLFLAILLAQILMLKVYIFLLDTSKTMFFSSFFY